MTTRGTGFQIGRRGLLAGAAGLSALSLLPGQLRAEDAPKRGGLLRMGIGGGSTTDDFDLRKLNDWVPVNQAYMVMNGLVEIDADNIARPELFESWKRVRARWNGCSRCARA